MYVYSVDIATVATVLAVSVRSLSRWYTRFRATGNVLKDQPRAKTSHWPSAVCAYVRGYVGNHPCFYFEELCCELRTRYKDSINVSDSTICRALRFDLNLTRKVLTKRARESVVRERQEYVEQLLPYYSGPGQLAAPTSPSHSPTLHSRWQVLRTGNPDTTCRSVLRRYGWSERNTPAHVTVPFSRGKRVSILAAMDVHVFLDRGDVDGTFTRVGFHDVFKERILPFLNSWPLPRSIVIMDNAKIHMYEKLQVLVHATGALLFFLLPYSPNLNSIEVGFLLLKRWIQRYANMAFREDPLAVLRVAMYECTKKKKRLQRIYIAIVDTSPRH
ncbi:Transposase [Phytophthora megakarya]|uniref:Transposase n=1 Tax=Phytophthora megakarya TaxID=4795 RepID=A0A225WUJ2_9STRA|nr:Transposase [Phytophthora megakarya]